MTANNRNQVYYSQQRAYVDRPASPPPPRSSTPTTTLLSAYLLAHCETPELSHSELLDRIHSAPSTDQHSLFVPVNDHTFDQQQRHTAETSRLQSELRAARAQRRNLRRDIRELQSGRVDLILEHQALLLRLRRMHEDQRRRDLTWAVEMEDLKSEHARRVHALEEMLRVEARIRRWGAALGWAFSGVIGAMIVGLLCVGSS
ncbi:uncharacterized protein L3040_003540 [Drepanopeziza brunnea f. sp. 'multigermtubi']|uniref:uncharacterized protein n=1 Tax=Drepanopeziza brunnea f. sp. 'multigermtubi' TaxID=698441 RepID=UPI002386EF48|nr:hypothetical protein L3040_003540 [Drepanopeziza brunnea f. sp. 'multigermtubi']